MRIMSVFGKRIDSEEEELISQTTFFVPMRGFAEKVKGCILCDLSRQGIVVTRIELEEGVLVNTVM